MMKKAMGTGKSGLGKEKKDKGRNKFKIYFDYGK